MNHEQQIANQIFNDLDVEINVPLLSEDGDWSECGKYRISTSKVGVMALMIKSLEVEIKVGKYLHSDGYSWKAVVQYDFRYEHPDGGRNGHGARVELNLER